jgi:SecD/SecF fusion protein
MAGRRRLQGIRQRRLGPPDGPGGLRTGGGVVAQGRHRPGRQDHLSPQVDPSVSCRSGIGGGSTQITGSFNADEAAQLALLINGGALPVPVETVEQRTVGPTLGAQAVTASAWAAAVGTTLTALFITTVALACYGLISYAALAALGATLPGLAGFVLLIGLAVGTYSSMFTATPLAIELHKRLRTRPAAAGAARTTGADRTRTRV